MQVIKAGNKKRGKKIKKKSKANNNKSKTDLTQTIKAKKCETKKKQVAITKQKNFCKKVIKNCDNNSDEDLILVTLIG